MPQTIIAAIVRASIARDREQMSAALAGVTIHRHGKDQIRAMATDGKFMVISHAWAAGWDVPTTVILSPDGIRRVIDLDRRTRKHLDGKLARHDPSKPGPALVTARIVASTASPKLTALEISVPSADEVIRCPLVNASPLAYETVEDRGKTWKRGMGAFGTFNLEFLSRLRTVFGKRYPVAFHNHRCQVFMENDTGDYALVMPVAAPWAHGETFIPFAAPEAAPSLPVAVEAAALEPVPA